MPDGLRKEMFYSSGERNEWIRAGVKTILLLFSCWMLLTAAIAIPLWLTVGHGR